MELGDTPMCRGQGDEREPAKETWKESEKKHKEVRVVSWKQGKREFLAGTSGQLCQRLLVGQDNNENKEVLGDLDVNLLGGVMRAEAWLKGVPERM